MLYKYASETCAAGYRGMVAGSSIQQQRTAPGREYLLQGKAAFFIPLYGIDQNA